MAKTKTAKRTQTKKLSPYNLFMREELPKYREANPETNHKDSFKAVAVLWATSPKNPKNKKTE